MLNVVVYLSIFGQILVLNCSWSCSCICSSWMTSFVKTFAVFTSLVDCCWFLYLFIFFCDLTFIYIVYLCCSCWL